MRLSTGIPVPARGESTFSSVADSIRDLERAGLDAVWAGESYGFDAVSVMAYIAARTERVQIGSNILQIYTRTPTLLAQTAAGLDMVSGGRAILGIGVSGPQVIEGFHGVPYDHPHQRTREVIEICRLVWQRDLLEYRGGSYTVPLPLEQGTGQGKPLKMNTHPLRSRIPIYVASLGPRNVELTSEIAEGWLPIYFIPERSGEIWGPALKRGLAKRSPDLGPLEVVAGGPVAIGEGLEGLRDRWRPRMALYIGGMGSRQTNFYNDLVRKYGFGAEAAEIQDLYLAGRKQEAEAKVPAGLLEAITLIGPREYVRDRIAAYRAAGVTTLNVTPIGPALPAETIAQMRDLIDAG
jgi:F420-dependent oxidoreductase-like protein